MSYKFDCTYLDFDCCHYVDITLSGYPQYEVGQVAGRYELQTGLVNGKVWWKRGSFAIWAGNGNENWGWMNGDLEDLGTYYSYLRTPEIATCVYLCNDWYYWSFLQNSFVSSDNIEIKCG